MNKIREIISSAKPESAPKTKKGITKPFFNVMNGSFLVNNQSPKKMLSFLLFLMGMAIFYIANIYYAEKIIRDTQKINGSLKELRSEHIALKSKLMFKSKQSEVAKSVEHLGLKESIVAPIKIIVTADGE